MHQFVELGDRTKGEQLVGAEHRAVVQRQYDRLWRQAKTELGAVKTRRASSA